MVTKSSERFRAAFESSLNGSWFEPGISPASRTFSEPFGAASVRFAVILTA
jgi:hypothetical protein